MRLRLTLLRARTTTTSAAAACRWFSSKSSSSLSSSTSSSSSGGGATLSNNDDGATRRSYVISEPVQSLVNIQAYIIQLETENALLKRCLEEERQQQQQQHRWHSAAAESQQQQCSSSSSSTLNRDVDNENNMEKSEVLSAATAAAAAAVVRPAPLSTDQERIAHLHELFVSLYGSLENQILRYLLSDDRLRALHEEMGGTHVVDALQTIAFKSFALKEDEVERWSTLWNKLSLVSGMGAARVFGHVRHGIYMRDARNVEPYVLTKIKQHLSIWGNNESKPTVEDMELLVSAFYRPEDDDDKEASKELVQLMKMWDMVQP